MARDPRQGATRTHRTCSGRGTLLVRPEYQPDLLEGVPFADADVTDESFEDRLAQEKPEQ